MLRCGSGSGVDAREILGCLAVGRVGRVLVEADPDVDRVGLAYDIESGECVGQGVAAIGVTEIVTEVPSSVAFERGPPDGLGPVPDRHGLRLPRPGASST